MGIRFACPNGHNLNVKEHLAGRRGICPSCGAKFVIPGETGNAFTAAPPPTELPSVVLATPTAELPAQPIVVVPSPAAPTEPADVITPPPVAPPDLSVVPSATESVEIVTDDSFLNGGEIPSEAMPVAQYVAHRRRSRRKQKTVAIALFGMVIVLAIVLVWVLSRDSQSVESSTGASNWKSSHEATRLGANDVLSARNHLS